MVSVETPRLTDEVRPICGPKGEQAGAGGHIRTNERVILGNGIGQRTRDCLWSPACERGRSDPSDRAIRSFELLNHVRVRRRT